MNASKADLILHPVRMKIIQCLAGGRRRTATQLSELMSDTPQATMYRHLKILLDNEILFVAEENPIRGTVEKVYALTENSGNMSREDFLNASREDHMHYFMKFLGTILGDFGQYLEGEEIDLEKDGVSYRQATMYLSDDEFVNFIQSLRSVYAQALQNEPSRDRKKRTISTIIIPERSPARE